MYDAEWATRVLRLYLDSGTRTGNLFNCIRQRALEQDRLEISDAMIQTALLWSIRSPKNQLLWRLFKRLNKRTPLDILLLETVTTKIIEAFYRDADERRQLVLF